MRFLVLGIGAAILGCANPLASTPPPRSPDAAPAPAPVRGPGRRPEDRPADHPTNVLVIVADDLGTDKVSAYREHPAAPSTPNIDGLAAAGVLFRNAYTSPVCSASRASLLTGRYPRRTGMGGIVELDQSSYELPLGEILIPEALERGEKDWHSAVIGKWHLSGFASPSGFRHPLLQGFDHHLGSLGNLVLTSRDYGQRGNYAHYEKNVDGKPEWSTTYATVETTTDAIGQLAHLAEPWFLWVAYNAPHDPFGPPPAELVRKRPSPDAPEVVLHTAMVEAMDHELGRLLAAMTEEQRASTMIVFVGDNGTSHEAILPPLDPKHGKASLYEGGTNVPLIVSGAGVGKRGAEAAALVHAVDLLPTILELTGGNTDGLVLDGVSFASVLSDPESRGLRKTVYTERFNPIGGGPYDLDLVAIRDERYKLMRTRKGASLVFDLADRNDDGEGTPMKSLTGPAREHAQALDRELDRISETVKFAW